MIMTRHAHTRAGQRGYRQRDIELITTFGTATSEGILLKRTDVDEARSFLDKAEYERLRRLIGTLIVIEDHDVVVTIQRADRDKVRRLLSRSQLSGPRRRNRHSDETDASPLRGVAKIFPGGQI